MGRLLKPGAALAAGVILLATRAQGTAPVSSTFKLGYAFIAYGYASGERFSRPSGVFYDPNRGELYVADTGNGEIVIFDKKGLPIARIGHSAEDLSGKGKAQAGEPRSVVVRKNGDILVADNLCSYVDILDFRGHSVQKFWPADLVHLPRTKLMPRFLAIDPSENVYIAVSGDENAILVLSPDLKLKAEIAKMTGPEAGIQGITGLWADKDGKIYVTYAQGDCVRIYGPDGQKLASFGKHDDGYDNFSLPSGLVTDAQANIWIADSLRHVVTAFKQEPAGGGIKTSVIHVLGGFGNRAGDFAYPVAIAGDGSTCLFVVETTGARVQGFNILFKSTNAKAN